MKRPAANRGFALVTAIISAAVFAIFAGGLIYLHRARTRNAVYDLKMLKARAAAEAGVACAMNMLQNPQDPQTPQAAADTKWPRDIPEQEVELPHGAKATVSCSRRGQTYVISSVGRWPISSDADIRSHLVVELRWGWPKAFSNAIFVREALVVDANSAKIQGCAASQKQVTTAGGAGIAIESDSRAPFPPLISKPYSLEIASCERTLAAPGRICKIYENNMTFTQAHPPEIKEFGLVYVKGNVAIDSPDRTSPLLIEGPGTIACLGDMTIAGHVKFKGQIKLICRGKMEIKGNVNMENPLAYGCREIMVGESAAMLSPRLFSKGKITFSGKSSATGAGLAYLMPTPVGTGAIGSITLDDSSRFSGSVIIDHPGAFQPNKDKVGLRIEKNAGLDGIAYVKGRVRLEGEVMGAVAAYGFEEGVFSKGTVYRSALPAEYELPEGLLDADSRVFEVASWQFK